MSIFGDLDVDEIGDDPFGIDDGTYLMEIIKSEYVAKKDNAEEIQLVITWQIKEDNSEFYGNTVQQRFPKPAPGTSVKDLDAKTLKALKFMKLTFREGLDLSEEEMRSVEPSDLLGRKAYVSVAKNDTYTNVRKVLCERLYQERQAELDASVAAQSSGLGL